MSIRGCHMKGLNILACRNLGNRIPVYHRSEIRKKVTDIRNLASHKSACRRLEIRSLVMGSYMTVRHSWVRDMNIRCLGLDICRMECHNLVMDMDSLVSHRLVFRRQVYRKCRRKVSDNNSLLMAYHKLVSSKSESRKVCSRSVKYSHHLASGSSSWVRHSWEGNKRGNSNLPGCRNPA